MRYAVKSRILFWGWFAFLGLLSAAGVAQDTKTLTDFKPQFNLFKLPGGRQRNSVNSILQDSLGFMWFGTHHGLVRYDGHFFKTYTHHPNDSNSLSANRIEGLCLDRGGNIWTAGNGGVNCFNPRTEKFTRYDHRPNDPTSLLDRFTTSVVEDRQGFIWIGTGEGLNRLNPADGTIKHFIAHPGDTTSLSSNDISSLYVDKQGTLWVGTGPRWRTDIPDGGLCRYNRATETFTRYVHDPNNPATLSGNKVRALLEDAEGNFWVGTEEDGVHLMNRQTGTFTRLRLDTDFAKKSQPGVNTLGFSAHVHTFLEDAHGNIWIGNTFGGLSIYQPSTGIVRHFAPRKQDNTTLESIFIYLLIQSKDGTIWIATGDYDAQVYRTTADKDYISNHSLENIVGSAAITSICYETDNRFWVSTLGASGLLHYDVKKGVLAQYQAAPAAIGHSFLNQIFYAFRDREGRLWMTPVAGEYALYRFDPLTQVFTPYLKLPDKPASRYHNDATVGYVNIVEDKQGDIWCVAADNKLLRVHKKTNQFDLFDHATTERPDGPDVMYTIFADKAGTIWASGFYQRNRRGYLDRFNPKTATWTPFLETQTRLSSICQDTAGKIWFSLHNEGIACLDPSGGEVQYYTAENGKLPSNDACTILPGLDGQLYVSFPDLLIRMNPSTGVWSPVVEVAPPQPELSFKGFRAPNGALLYPWANADGFMIFSPQKLAAEHKIRASNVRITGLLLYDQPQQAGEHSVLRVPIWETRQLRLSHADNYFTFQFSSFDYQATGSKQYEFMLEGYDPYWRKTQEEPSATYLNVFPGSYTFRVRAADRALTGEAAEARLLVIVRPAWWRTGWASGLAVLAAVGIGVAVYRFQLQHRLAAAEAQRLQALDTLKTRLYTNITHEFRTPLTIILGMARQVLDNPKDHFRSGLDMIIRNGQQLLALVNQLLDLSRLESGKMNLHLTQGNVIPFLNYVLESFHSLADYKNIQLHFHADTDTLVMDYDPERLQQVVANLLSNAVKFTGEGGRVDLSVSTWPVAAGRNLQINVRDTGVGIAETDLPHLFERFFQADDSHTRRGEGTGIGLALTRELVKLMQGDIQVKSEPGQGAEFIVMLPIQRASPAATPSMSEAAIPAGPKATVLPDSATAGPRDKPTILVMEDNADVITYLASCLQEHYQVQVAKDGREGIALALQSIPDLIITDVMMPHQDGFAVCQTLKNEERTSHIPIVMLTAKADLDSKLEGLERGADDYLAKPFHKEELLVRVRKLLELRQKLQRYYLAVAGLTEEVTIRKDLAKIAAVENVFVKRVRQVVEAHLDDPEFNVETLCKAVMMSHSQLHRKLSALTGFSANTFIRSVRLTKARELLRNPALTIASIAYDTGFNDPSYFGRVFKQEFGVTPQEWRESTMNL